MPNASLVPIAPVWRQNALARRAGHRVGLGLVLAGILAGCSPLVRPAPFVGARDIVTDVSLLGPFDGQVLDESTGEPIYGATVVGVWSFDKGDGFIGPSGSESVPTKTDQAGRYRIPAANLRTRGAHVRLVSFHLVVYKRGYVGYRSDTKLDGQPRNDFALRHNRVELRKWRESDSHAHHLMFLAAPPEIQQLVRWEREPANLDLYREMGGAEAPREQPGPAEQPTGLRVLEAAKILTPEEVRRRTGYTDAFDVKELGDLARTHFYHGVHLEAADREESWDLAYRVWRDPPGGLGPVLETFKATLPGVEATTEITAETWVYEAKDVRAVAFLDREANLGVLLTCGANLCVDIETAIILAGYVHENIDKLELVDAPKAPKKPAAEPAPKPAAEPTKVEEP